MNKDRSYFVFLEALEKPGCPICHLVVDDSRGYLDSLMYERVLDVPTRLGLMDSFGFCNWHTWQIPALPPICAPTVGFSIFASDLLRKFDLLTQIDARSRLFCLAIDAINSGLIFVASILNGLTSAITDRPSPLVQRAKERAVNGL
jgi:hypothetical protein